jgi:alcohol dehydrogenase
MRAWRLAGAGGRFALDEIAKPELRAGSVRVRMEAAPVLSYMGDVVEGRLAAYRFPATEFTPGTNGVGVVDAVGPGVYHLSRGQRVVLSPHLVAQEVAAEPAQILIGLTSISADSGALQADWPDGTFAEYALMPASVLTPCAGLDAVAPARLAALAKFAVPFGGLLRARFEPGETLIVNGASGYFGSAAVLLGLALGAARVVAAARDAPSLEALRVAGGARVTAIALSGDESRDVARLREASGGGAHAAIDLVGRATDARSTLATLRSLRRGGRLVLMGSMTAPLELAYGELMLQDWSVLGCFMYPRDAIARLLELVRAGLLDLSRVRLASHALADLPAAMAVAAKMRGLDATVLTIP